MARIKIPGVYMIRNVLNGKVYIGESKDIRTRWSKYLWAAKSNREYHETKRPLSQAFRSDGIENFEFIILESGDAYNDINVRLTTEAQYIAKYNSTDPDYGYNLSPGFEYLRASDDTPRKQSMSERYKRCKPIVEYDIETGSMMVYLGGARSWGEAHGYGKDVSSHTVKRGSLIENRYYLIYADPEQRRKQLEIVRSKKIDTGSTGHAAVRLANAFYKYEAAVNAVDACELFCND